MPPYRPSPARALLPALLLLLSARASADAPSYLSPYSQSVAKEGPGFRLGSSALTLHPGVALETGYDSNIFYLPVNEVGAALLRVRGHVDLATLSGDASQGESATADPKLDFRFSTQVEYREYLTGSAAVQAQRSLNVSAGANLTILPRGPLTLELDEVFVRTVDPRNFESPGNYTRDYNRVGLLGQYQIGALTVGASNHFAFTYWETPEIQFGNSLSDEGRLFGRLRLLQQTYVTLVLRFGYVGYERNHAIDSFPFRAILGGSTLFTRWLGAAFGVGYGNSFNTGSGSFGSIIGNLDIRFLLPRSIKITAGYNRDFSDSIFATYFADDYLFLVYEQPVLSGLSAHFEGGVRFRHYGTLINPMLFGATGYGTPTRDDILYNARAELGYRITDWCTLSANYNLQGNSSDFTILSGSGVSRVSYIKHSAFFRIDIAY